MNKKDNIQKSEIERDSSGRYLIKSSSKANPETEEIHNSKSQKTISNLADCAISANNKKDIETVQRDSSGRFLIKSSKLNQEKDTKSKPDGLQRDADGRIIIQ